jgi:hypothetical protein
MTAALLLLLSAKLSAQTLDSSFQDASDAARAAAAHPAVVVDAKAIGSWYRKIASVDTTDFDAVTARGVLPQPAFDPARMHSPAPGEGAWTEGPLDNPGVYIGVHAQDREIDAGLKWDHRYDEKGRDTGLYAWRVFWRTASPGSNVWKNPDPGSAQDLYLTPGQPFTMTLTLRPDGTEVLQVGGDGAGAPSMSVAITLDGFFSNAARLPRRFKRVDSIDQFRADPGGPRVGNEGSPAIPTKATLSDGKWDAVELTAGARRAPLTGALAVEYRGADEDSAYRAVFPASGPDAKGGEEIVIAPPHP